MEYFGAQLKDLSLTRLQVSNGCLNCDPGFDSEQHMSRRDKLNLAGLGVGLARSAAWTVFLGFVLSKGIERLPEPAWRELSVCTGWPKHN